MARENVNPWPVEGGHHLSWATKQHLLLKNVFKSAACRGCLSTRARAWARCHDGWLNEAGQMQSTAELRHPANYRKDFLRTRGLNSVAQCEPESGWWELTFRTIIWELGENNIGSSGRTSWNVSGCQMQAKNMAVNTIASQKRGPPPLTLVTCALIAFYVINVTRQRANKADFDSDFMVMVNRKDRAEHYLPQWSKRMKKALTIM